MPFWSDGKAGPVAVLHIVIGASGAQIMLGGPSAGHRTAHARFEAGRMAAAVRAFTLQARAKFNVRLEVGAQAPDGLHAIRSLVGADQCVVQLDRLKDGPQLVVAVRPHAEYAEVEIHLRVRPDP